MGIEFLATATLGLVQGSAEWASDRLSTRIGLKQWPSTRFVLQWLIGCLLFLLFVVAGIAAVLGLWFAGSAIARWIG